jgi:hypothetical protein
MLESSYAIRYPEKIPDWLAHPGQYDDIRTTVAVSSANRVVQADLLTRHARFAVHPAAGASMYLHSAIGGVAHELRRADVQIAEGRLPYLLTLWHARTDARFAARVMRGLLSRPRQPRPVAIFTFHWHCHCNSQLRRHPMSTVSIVIVIAIALIGAALLVWGWRRERTRHLRSQFGPEYDQALNTYGKRGTAERALEERQKRMEGIEIHPLGDQERDRFAHQWQRVQSLFVDDPVASIHDADRLVCAVMRARGYPMADFEHRAADLSVGHPRVVKNYRSAHEIALRLERKQCSTEDLRQALVYYRDLFEELLEAHVAGLRG